MLCYVKARSPRHFFFAQIILKKNCSLINVVFIYLEIRLVWCKASMDHSAGSMLTACVCFCILISSQNTKVSIYVVANTSKWHEASMRSVVPVLHVWSRWFDACGWHLFLYTNFKYVAICIVANRCEEHEASMRSGAPVLHVWSVESLVRGSCLYTILCTNFKSKYKSVYLYSRKYAYIVRSVHDHVSGIVALFVRRKLWARRYFCIQITSQELPKYTYSHKYGQNVGSIQAHRATAVCWFEACGVRLLLCITF
jgi:hypothetical protein